MLVPARNKKKKWSKEDEAYLQDNWGMKSIKTICKTLGRSENAVIVRAQRLGCGAFLDAGLYITYNQLMTELYGKCGECRDYHIPATQKPCQECKYCRQRG